MQLYSPRTILDIGANTGQFAQLTRELMPNVRILSFEPLQDCVASLQADRTRLAPLEIFPFALGDADKSTQIYRNRFTPSSSLLKMETLHIDEMPATANADCESIEVRRLDGLAPQLKVEEPLFVKIDVQGYTEPVLTGGESVIRRACAVVAEVSVQPLYKGETTFQRVFNILTEWGFSYRGNIDQWISPRDGRILQCDCLFENTKAYLPHEAQHMSPVGNSACDDN